MKHAVCVLKFGGTSVGSGERIRRVAAIIANARKASNEGDDFPVVVVSAMSGVTDQLLRIARFACTGEDEACAEELASLRRRHLEAAEHAVHDSEARASLCADLETALARLEQNTSVLRLAAREGQDIALPTAAVAAWGERFSVLLVAAAPRSAQDRKSTRLSSGH